MPIRLQLILGTILVVISLVVVVSCRDDRKMKNEDRARRESAAKVWAGFVEGAVVACSHPKFIHERSSCSVQSPKCRYLIFCRAGACKRMDSTCPEVTTP